MNTKNSILLFVLCFLFIVICSAQESWTPTSTGVNVPSSRDQHTAVWSGTKMIIMGGLGSGYYNTGGLYDPSNSTSNDTTPQLHHPTI